MRIGIVTGEYPPMQGGVGAFSQIMAATLAEQGHEVHVLTHAEAAPTPGVVVANRVGKWSRKSPAIVREWARAEQLDIVNLQYQTAAYAMSPWIHAIPDIVRSTAPVVTTFHDLRFPYLFPKAGPLRRGIVHHLARSSSGVIATNAEDHRVMSNLPHVALIPIGSNITVSADPVRAKALRASVGKKAFVVGYFGFLNANKGIDALIMAHAQLLLSRIPARLVLIGGRTGSSDPSNEAYAANIDALMQIVDIDIHRTGYVDDAEVANWLAACDVVALPFLDGASYRRGTLMAAIQHGCAIVTTTPRVPIPAFVDGENMRFTPPGDGQALAAELANLYDDPAQRDRLRAGAAALRPLFDWSRIARDTVQFFETVI